MAYAIFLVKSNMQQENESSLLTEKVYFIYCTHHFIQSQ